jgi:hypothetical protein
MSATEVAAWWGAVAATLVIVWDVYKWATSGPRVRIRVEADRLMVGDPMREGETFITVRATNTGDRPTTLTNLGFSYYRSWWHRKLLRKPDSNAVVTLGGTPHQLPHKLEPGGVWDGAAIQDEELKKMAAHGYLEMVVYQSHTGRPKRAHVERTRTD